MAESRTTEVEQRLHIRVLKKIRDGTLHNNWATRSPLTSSISHLPIPEAYEKLASRNMAHPVMDCFEMLRAFPIEQHGDVAVTLVLSLSGHIHALKSRNRNLEEKLLAETDLVAATASEKYKLRHHVAKIQSDNENFFEQVEHGRQITSRIVDNLTSSVAEANRGSELLRKRLQNIKNQNLQLQNELSTLKEVNSRLKGQLQTLEDKPKTSTSDLAKARLITQQVLNDAQSCLTESEREKDNLQKQLATVSEENKRLRILATGLSKENANLQRRDRSSIREVARLNAESASNNNSIAARLQGDRLREEHRVTALQRNSAMWKRRCKSWTRRAAIGRGTISKVHDRLREAHTELARLESRDFWRKPTKCRQCGHMMF